MQVYSRAGLVALIFAFAIALTTAAPIAKNAIPVSVSVRTANGLNVNRAALSAIPRQKEGALVFGNLSAVNLEEKPTLVRRKVHISAKVKHAFQKVGHAFKHADQKVGHAFKHAAQKVGHTFKHAAQKVGHTFKHASAAQKVGHAFKHAAQKVGRGIKTAAKKVGHFIKTTGAQVAKFGLKLASTAEKIASKVVSFIPGVGKVVSKALDGASAATNAISDRIHVKLPKRLQHGMNAMNKVRKISGYVPRELSELDLDAREDFYDLEEREWEDWEGL